MWLKCHMPGSWGLMRSLLRALVTSLVYANFKWGQELGGGVWNKIIRIGLVTALIKAEQCTGIRKRCCYSGKGWPLLLVPKVLSSFRPKCSLLHLGSRIQHFQPGTREQQLSRAKDPSPKGAATMETSIDFPQKIKNRTTIWSSNLTFGYIDKGDEIPISRRYLHSHVWKF